MHANVADFVARFLLGLIFLISGVRKIIMYSGSQDYMEAFGVPGALLPLVILLEIGGALALILGVKVRWAAAALAVFTLLAGLIFHMDLGDSNQLNHLLKNLAMVGGLLMVVLYGPQEWALGRKSRLE